MFAVLVGALAAGLALVAIGRRKRARRWAYALARVALVVASLAGASIAAEWAARRIHPGGMMQATPRAGSLPTADLETLPGGLAYWDYRGVLGFDERGFRGRYEAPGAGYKMLILGDSVAYGAGVPGAAAFPRLLQRRLTDCANGQLFDIAVPGYSPLQERIAFARKGAALRPDVVLLAVVPNDIEQYTVIGGTAYDIRVRQSYGRPVFAALPLPDALNEALFFHSALYQSLTLTTLLAIDSATGRPQTARKMALQEHQRLLDDVRATGAELVLAMFPGFERPLYTPEGDPFYAMVRAWAAKAGVKVLEMRPPLATLPLDVVSVDSCCHLSEAGHELAADALWRGLGEHGLLPTGCTATVAAADPANAVPVRQAWLPVPAGSVTMGTHSGQFDEKPPQKVFVSAFALQRTEVTVAEYAGCVAAGKCRDNHTQAAPGHPVTSVSWTDAATYCQWIGGRLPTEAEWERAARGDDDRLYPWGDEPARGRANCGRGCDDRFAKTAPVGSFSAGKGPFGTLDQAGNVEEWVADWYGEGYAKFRPNRDPKGPAAGIYRAVRGGDYQAEDRVMRASNRYWAPVEQSNERRGMRCAK